MKVQINAGEFHLTESIDQYIQEELSKALKLFDERITRVEVHLHDDKRSRNGINDKRCVMEVRIGGRPPLVVEDQSNDMYQTIKSTAEKLSRAVTHDLERLRDRQSA